MDWDKLKVFYSVAKSGSFTKAATALDVSQSAISRQISGLEDMLSTSLFYRHARGLTLTEQGETLLKTTREVFSELTLVERQIKYSSKQVAGPLTVVAPVAFGNAWILPHLNEFLELYPHVSFRLQFSDAAVDLSFYDADISISDQEGNGERFLSHKLVPFPLRIYSSRNYLLEQGVPLALQQLDHHQLVVFGEESALPPSNPNLLLNLERPASDPRRPYMRINNVYTIAQTVAGGAGIALLPSYVADHCSGLVQILPEVELPEVTLYFSYAHQLSESQPVKAFYEFISQKVKKPAAKDHTVA